MDTRRRLPSLKGLRAFESAARHLSLTLAAEELHVTPAAISQQIAGLEDHFGAQLFERGNRQLRLTEAASTALPLIRQGFDHLADGVEQIRSMNQHSRLHLRVAPSFAGKWLIPHLDDFSSHHPELDVQVDAEYGLPDFRGDGTDLAIHYGDGHYGDLYSERLFAVSAVPVCSPKLLKGEHPLRKIADLRHFRLLHDETLLHDADKLDWASWLKAAGVHDMNTERGVRFNHTALAMDAAIAGQGVALGLDRLVMPEIRAGRLVVPFDIRMPLNSGYFLVGPSNALDKPKVAAFRDWIITQAADDEQDTDLNHLETQTHHASEAA